MLEEFNSFLDYGHIASLIVQFRIFRFTFTITGDLYLTLKRTCRFSEVKSMCTLIHFGMRHLHWQQQKRICETTHGIKTNNMDVLRN